MKDSSRRDSSADAGRTRFRGRQMRVLRIACKSVLRACHPRPGPNALVSRQPAVQQAYKGGGEGGELACFCQ